MAAKLSQEEANFNVLSECTKRNFTCEEFIYIGAMKTKLPLTCINGHKLKDTSYNNFVNNKRGCPTCANNQLLTQTSAELYIDKLCKELNYMCENFEYIGTDDTKLQLTCDKGHSWDTTSYYCFVTRGTRCQTCAGNKKITQEEAEKNVQSVCKDKNYTYLDFVYKGKDETKISLTCDKGHSWNITSYNSFVNKKTGCPECAGNKKITQEEAETNVLMKCNEFNYICSNFLYIGCIDTKLPLTCDKGHSWDTTSYYCFVNGCVTCPSCISRESKNLTEIDVILVDFKIEKEKRFDNCKFNKKLPFDRYISSINLLIEYDGSQHFEFKEFWHKSKTEFKKSQKRDKIKTEYAINNGYNFIRIAYYEDHVQTLESFLALVLKHPDKQIVQLYGDVQILDKQ